MPGGIVDDCEDDEAGVDVAAAAVVPSSMTSRLLFNHPLLHCWPDDLRMCIHMHA